LFTVRVFLHDIGSFAERDDAMHCQKKAPPLGIRHERRARLRSASAKQLSIAFLSINNQT
jgi:hypothetical protein